jgi:hypothetical protein
MCRPTQVAIVVGLAVHTAALAGVSMVDQALMSSGGHNIEVGREAQALAGWQATHSKTRGFTTQPPDLTGWPDLAMRADLLAQDM